MGASMANRFGLIFSEGRPEFLDAKALGDAGLIQCAQKPYNWLIFGRFPRVPL